MLTLHDGTATPVILDMRRDILRTRIRVNVPSPFKLALISHHTPLPSPRPPRATDDAGCSCGTGATSQEVGSRSKPMKRKVCPRRRTVGHNTMAGRQHQRRGLPAAVFIIFILVPLCTGAQSLTESRNSNIPVAPTRQLRDGESLQEVVV